MEFWRPSLNRFFVSGLSLAFVASSGCLGSSNSGGGASPTTQNTEFGPGTQCTVASGAAWVPNVPGVSSSNHDSTVSVSSQTYTADHVLLSGLGDPMTGREVTVHFTVDQDLGLNGSVSMLAQVTNYSSDVDHTAYPLLTYLSDGTNEYVNLTRGSAGDCLGKGFFTCSSDGAGNESCAPNAACTIGYPSAYSDFYHYWVHQVPNFGRESVNVFPTCRWSEGSTTALSSSSPSCAFNSYLASNGGHLPVGSYTAKYFLIADQYASMGDSGSNASLKVIVVQKKDPNTSVGGAVDVNVVLVGTHNIQDSHLAAGQRNLNTLFKSLNDYLAGEHLGVANANIKIGKINVYELSCSNGGDALSNVSSNTLGYLLSSGSALVDPASAGKALNVFLISQFSSTLSDEAGILGISGGINGPMVNGLSASGLAFATFDKLGTFNSSCTASPCPLTSQDSDFYEMGNTIAHEMGHYLGLNHPSESAGTIHDVVYDTPVCSAISTATGTIGIGSCLNYDTNIFAVSGKTCNQACTGYNSAIGQFCADAPECGFNHMMWWSSKHFYPATGTADGNQFSPDSGIIMNLSSFVR